ncbi:PQQ-dependent sugar dehydrogenase [Synoicihabitans lomoniglobus]|uniref:PQQ-dependent sugar dehydrogenase n=1 Tax=Synoicihabitans lomoniglobus TaxID=2909285 RepID=UPI002ED2558B|nr:PQQ-dependent sugar dehydrogenase [Opitutaceae bacterium LMO-M01]
MTILPQVAPTFLVTVGILALSPAALAADTITPAVGRELFAQHCGACHELTIDSFGPPLGGITRLLSTEELTTWISDPAKVLASADPRAAALLARHKAPMPPFAFLGAEKIAAILAYLDTETEARDLTPFTVDLNPPVASASRLIPRVVDSGIVVELEDFAQIPRLPGRPAYKGIALLRPDPRDDDALLVNDLMGIIYRIKNGVVDTFLDVRGRFPRFVYEPGVATGLGAFAFHPAFLTNGLLYTTHAELWLGEDCINPDDLPDHIPADASPRLAWVLTEWHAHEPLAATFAGTRREVMRWVTPTTAHGSQEIAFAPVTGPDDPDYGLLYIGHGDGGAINIKRPDIAGHPRTLLTSIMRIDPTGTNGRNGRYGIPPDNPFAGSDDPTVRQEIWAYGFRNAHRMSWDITPQGKRMIAVDIGESNVEEVNLIEPGWGYGWGVGKLEGTARLDVLDDPTVIWPATAAELAPHRSPHGEYMHDDGTAVTGGYVYHGPLELLRGKYVFGDIVNGRLFCMNIGESLDDHTIYELKVVTAAGEPTSVKTLAGVDRAHLRVSYDPRHGDLFVMTKDDGMIRRVVRASLP